VSSEFGRNVSPSPARSRLDLVTTLIRKSGVFKTINQKRRWTEENFERYRIIRDH